MRALKIGEWTVGVGKSWLMCRWMDEGWWVEQVKDEGCKKRKEDGGWLSSGKGSQSTEWVTQNVFKRIDRWTESW